MVQSSAVLILVLMITGCASQRLPEDSEGYKPPPELKVASTWMLEGKIGVKTGEGGANMSFVWMQKPDKYEITLTGVLGTGIAKVIGNTRGVTLSLPDGEKYQSTNINELLKNQLGYPIPVAQLHYWVRGIPDPQIIYSLSDAGFSQQGWQVAYRKFDSEGPVNMLIEQGSVRVKLAALKWEY
jgi:outer membrane lipoprotein LolB